MCFKIRLLSERSELPLLKRLKLKNPFKLDTFRAKRATFLHFRIWHSKVFMKVNRASFVEHTGAKPHFLTKNPELLFSKFDFWIKCGFLSQCVESRNDFGFQRIDF